MDVLVREGNIERFGRELTAQGLASLDASGLFLYPGLITSHAHLQSVPGSVLRGDDFEPVKVQQALQLRAYLACGFTSVLDPAIGPETAVRLRAHVGGGQPGPDIFILAPFVTPADGYMTSKKIRGAAFADFWPAVAEDTDIVEFINSAKSLKPVGVKVAIEDGVVFPNLPVFAEKTIKAIRDAGQKTGSRLYVHSNRNDEHRIALSLRPYALVHVGMWDDTLADDVLATLKRDQIYVISTATLQPLSNWGWFLQFAKDRWIKQRVPVLQWSTATHPYSTQAVKRHYQRDYESGYVPAGLAPATASWFTPSPEEAAEAGAKSAAAIKLLHENGGPWVVGADEGNSPAYTTSSRGPSQIELELLDKAGIPRAAIIAAARTTPVKMLGITERFGTVETGKQADLILLKKDPIQHGMKALRSLQWTIKRGDARTPASWLTQP